MRLSRTLLAATAVLAATAALAGPPVTVTFKNNTGAVATYTIATANEASTYPNASPTPATKVSAGFKDVYVVTSRISPDLNYAVVHYKAGLKECVFGTTFVNALQPGGYKAPQWNKTATGSGGATCTAKITAANPATYAWAVDFVMK